MTGRQHGMPPDHPGAGIAHDLLDAPALFGLVAMHGTLVAHRLPIPKRALGNPTQRIRQKSGAIFAQILFRTMVGAAVDSDHDGDRSGFKIHAVGFIAKSNPFPD